MGQPVRLREANHSFETVKYIKIVQHFETVVKHLKTVIKYFEISISRSANMSRKPNY